MEDIFWELLDLLGTEKSEGFVSEVADLLDPDPRFRLTTESEEFDVRLGKGHGIAFVGEVSREACRFFELWSERVDLSDEGRNRDELTGLYTRSYWERELRTRLAGSIKSLAMVDVDNFKHFNDTYGHQTGDRVLEAVGEKLLEYFLGKETTVRYGGEEFMVLSEEPEDKSAGRMEKLRQSVAAEKLFPEQPEKVTLSAGVAGRGRRDFATDELIERADRALYEAKTSGRNRLYTYAPYMGQAARFYVWGVHRYLWGTRVRFAMSEDTLLFFRLDDGFCSYNWRENTGKSCRLPDDFQGPPRSMNGFGDTFYLLDSSGLLWGLEKTQDWNKLSAGDTPELTNLLTNNERLFATGINNQLYGVESQEVFRYNSLPDEWDQLVFSGRLYHLLGRKMYSAGKTELAVLPEKPLQVTGEGDLLYIVGKSGKIYRFSTVDQEWVKLEFVNSREKIRARELTASDSRLLIRDTAGRMLLCRKKAKAIPQRMNFS